MIHVDVETMEVANNYTQNAPVFNQLQPITCNHKIIADRKLHDCSV